MFSSTSPSENNLVRSYFSEGMAPIVNSGYIDCSGHLSIKWASNLELPFKDGLASVCGSATGTFGYLDRSGAMAIGPFKWFRQGITFDHGFAVVQPKEETVGLIDRVGNWILGPIVKEDGWRYHGGWIERRTKSGVLLDNIVTGVSIQLDVACQPGRFMDGLSIATIAESTSKLSTFTGVRDDGTIAFSITSNSEIYNIVQGFHDGLAVFDSGSGAHFGYMNKNGVVQIPAIYRFAYSFQEGLAPVSPYEAHGVPGWGYINQLGEYQIEPRAEFVGADCFSEGMAAICAWNDGTDFPPKGDDYNGRERWGYIDRAGSWKIPPVFCMAGPFREGYANVHFKYVSRGDSLYDDDGDLNEQDCSLAFISRDGEFIWPPQLAGRNIKDFVVPDPRGTKTEVPPFMVLLPD